MDEDTSVQKEAPKARMGAFKSVSAPAEHEEPAFSQVQSDAGSRDAEGKQCGDGRIKSAAIATNERANDRIQSHTGANASKSKLRGYDNWSAVAGFFDGDGGLDVEARTYTLHWVLNFTDNWPPQLLQVKQFMESQGIKVGAIRRAGTGGHKIEVAEIASLQRCALAMLEGSSLFKKRKEVEFILDYFRGRIKGDDVIELLNEEVKAGIRVGKPRSLGVPYTYPEGKQVYKKGHVWNSLRLLALTEQERKAVRRKYVRDGLTIYQLASLYQVSASTIFREVRELQRGAGK
jgi:hypothetical protein